MLTLNNFRCAVVANGSLERLQLHLHANIFSMHFESSNPTDLCTHYICFALHGFEVIKIRDCQIRSTDLHCSYAHNKNVARNIELLYHLTTLVGLNVFELKKCSTL